MAGVPLKSKIAQGVIRNPYFIKITITIYVTVLFCLFNKFKSHQYLLNFLIFNLVSNMSNRNSATMGKLLFRPFIHNVYCTNREFFTTVIVPICSTSCFTGSQSVTNKNMTSVLTTSVHPFISF